MDTGLYKGVEYSLTEDQLNSLVPFYRNMVNIAKKSDVFRGDSSNKLYLNNMNDFVYKYNSSRYASTVNNSSYLSPKSAFLDFGVTAEDYFLGSIMSQQEWERTYSKYLQ
jgi:hypothetical protein